MEEVSQPLTALAWTSGQQACPKGYNMIVATMEGASANFVKGFGQRSAVYLCCSTVPESHMGQVITEIHILSDKTPLPVGCAYIGEYIDSSKVVQYIQTTMTLIHTLSRSLSLALPALS
ncbi:hypothetical protein FKM82_025007, partial [Ascaphus truei]